VLIQSNISEKRKSSNDGINKSTSHIDRGFELILSGGKKKRPKSFSIGLNKVISLFRRKITVHLDFFIDIKK
jgi:hypothetical protein